MSLNDSIDALATGQYTITRRAKGTYTDGVYSGPGSSTTFAVTAVMEPATGLQRVVGGFETRADYAGRTFNDIRVLYTKVELFGEEDPAYEPDLVTIGSRQYTVWRVEPWDIAFYQTDNTVHYRILCTRLGQGT